MNKTHNYFRLYIAGQYPQNLQAEDKDSAIKEAENIIIGDIKAMHPDCYKDYDEDDFYEATIKEFFCDNYLGAGRIGNKYVCKRQFKVKVQFIKYFNISK